LMRLGYRLVIVEGKPSDPGKRYLLTVDKQGAKLVDSAADILEELQMAAAPPALHDAPELDPGAARLFAQLGFEPTGLDALCARCGMGADTVSALLLKLELQGLIAALPGAQYQRVR